MLATGGSMVQTIRPLVDGSGYLVPGLGDAGDRQFGAVSYSLDFVPPTNK
jgi:uracil phosphoribosyltransferase